MIRWTLITVTHNSSEALRTHWNAPRPGDVEWLVIDNSSSDRSVEVATDFGASVLPLSRNRGFAVANNLGLKQAQGTYVAFVNPDVRVDYESLRELEDRINKVGGIVVPQLVNEDGSLQPNARGAPFLVDKLAHRGINLPLARRSEYVLEFDEGPAAVPILWAIGAAVAARTDLFHFLGGWDERFFLYYEDHELGMRAWERGVPVWLDRQVRWEHGWERATTRVALEPWRRELASAVRFYRMFPGLLVPTRRRRVRFARMLDLPHPRDPWMDA